MSKNQTQKSTGIPTWAKVLLAATGIGAVAVVGYYAITNIFGGGINAYKEMFTQQYNALMQKMANYTEQNGSSGFTASQQANIAEEEKVLALTEQGLANASNGLYNTLETIAAIMVAGAAAVGISAVIVRGWLSKTGQRAYTGYGASYIAVRSLSDQLASQGNYIQATNIISSVRVMFQTTDLPAMQQTVVSLQAQLATLTGIQLLTAQQMIAQLSIEITAIPIWLALPLPI